MTSPDEPTPKRSSETPLEQLVFRLEKLRWDLDPYLREVHKPLKLRERIAWLIATPALAGAILLGYLVVAWGIVGTLAASSTTAAAFVVAGALILVPTVIGFLEDTSVATQTERTFRQAVEFFSKELGEITESAEHGRN